jgi:hypothetical protein
MFFCCLQAAIIFVAGSQEGVTLPALCRCGSKAVIAGARTLVLLVLPAIPGQHCHVLTACLNILLLYPDDMHCEKRLLRLSVAVRCLKAHSILGGMSCFQLA